jgi:hypothetical protein
VKFVWENNKMILQLAVSLKIRIKQYGVITRNSAVSPDMSLLAAEQHCPMSLLAAEQHCPMSLLAAMRFCLMSLLATARYCLILIFKDTAN